MKRVLAFVVLLGFGGFGGLGGCIILDSPEDDMCAFRYRTCNDNCTKRALGSACKWCCGRQRRACDSDGGGNFDPCMD